MFRDSPHFQQPLRDEIHVRAEVVLPYYIFARRIELELQLWYDLLQELWMLASEKLKLIEQARMQGQEHLYSHKSQSCSQERIHFILNHSSESDSASKTTNALISHCDDEFYEVTLKNSYSLN
jgi:hypothetical protein